MKMYPVFHVSLLEPIRNPENKDNKMDNKKYKIEKILKRKSEKK